MGKNKGKKARQRKAAAAQNNPREQSHDATGLNERKLNADVAPECQGASASGGEPSSPSSLDTVSKRDQLVSGEPVEDNGYLSVTGADQKKPPAEVPLDPKGASTSGDKITVSSSCDTDIKQQQPPTPEDVEEHENGEKFYPCDGNSEGDFVVVKGMSQQLLDECEAAVSKLGEMVSVCTEIYGFHGNKGATAENIRIASTPSPSIAVDQTEKLELIKAKQLLQDEKEALEKEVENKERRLQQIEKDRDELQKNLEEKKEELTKYKENFRKEKETMKLKYQEKEERLKKIEQEKMEMKNQHQRESERKMNQYNGEMANRKRKLEESEQRGMQLSSANKILQTEKEYWEKERQDMNECIKHLREENDSLSTSLSKMMNDKMNEDESQVENVCIKARPLKLVEEYELFCTDEWLGAKTELDDATDVCFLMQEDKKHKLLLDILMEASRVTPKHFEDHMKHMKQLLDDPMHGKEKTSAVVELNGVQTTVLSDYTSTTSKMSSELETEIIKYLKIHSDHIDCVDMAKSVLDKVLTNIPDTEISPQTKSSENLLKYTVSACVLTWKMALQRPPMYFEADEDVGESYNADKHDLQFGTMDPRTPGAVIMYYVFPALWHSGKLMKKGRVILGNNM